MQELSRLERELESTDVKNKKLIHKATDWYFSQKILNEVEEYMRG